jgi:hypothetical protein
MEKRVKLFWRYFGSILVLVEISVYFLSIQNSLLRPIICFAFLLINALIIAYLVQVKLEVEKHNAAIDAAASAATAQKKPASEVAIPAEPAPGSFAYTLTRMVVQNLPARFSTHHNQRVAP